VFLLIVWRNLSIGCISNFTVFSANFNRQILSLFYSFANRLQNFGHLLPNDDTKEKRSIDGFWQKKSNGQKSFLQQIIDKIEKE
jgi:hypothetical protein